MEEIKVKDIIFSFRHVYLDNQKKLNKRLKKNIKINTPLIKDVTLYFKDSNKSNIGIKYIFKNNSIGDLIYRFCDKMGINSKLIDYAEIRKDPSGNLETNTNYVTIKGQKLSKDIDCIKKEEFYQNIVNSFGNSKIRISFTNYEITIACEDFILCYNSVGDLIYTFSSNNTSIKDMLNTYIDINLFSKYHRDIIKKGNKVLDIDSNESKKYESGDFLVKEENDEILLKKLRKGKLPRYI